MRKSVLIMGSTDGIGKGTAIKLAEDGWKILIHGRSMERVDKTVWEIRNRLGNVDVVGYHGDFSSLREVEKMAEKIMSTEGSLNALLNNAGTLMKSFKLSEDGFEMSFAVNHLAHFYLSGRLLPLLLKTVNSRIINISSGIHSGKIDLNKFMLAENFEPVNTYSASKLCNILFSYKLAAILKGMPITVNCMHPGVINNKILNIQSLDI